MAISQEISYRLERLILDGGLAPEQKIPSERQLATRLGVSRAVIREALHELQGRGVIETRHGKGSFVASMLPRTDDLDPQSPLMLLFEGHPRTLFDLLEVREQLEGQAAYLAAKRATTLDLHRITKAYTALEQTDPLTNARPDHNFHQAIVEASHNPVLVHVLNGLKNLMLLTVQASVANLNPREEMRNKISRQHKRIYQAVMAKNPEAARRIAMSHVRFVSDAMRGIEQQGTAIIREPFNGPASVATSP
ncbi:GntR family transcriptional regulator [Marinobacter vulgaris]|uniref:GntR family transcriptional regulator n=1 Tax=Marinobacter vulgaris TaxID=1928331 RepID=A0A2V3ZSM0_9GAMM|nr:FCD domain-containing protein [Marinobacter vulgaris]PXX93623.1 GntR family transcriptional regulator [Marinobacter vulgaris]TSJ72360.1 FCD domain-containing protein [Marinobacter vulgaris]